MESEADINAKIIKLTMVIQDNYPELMNYLNEMPITVPIDSNPEINAQNLQKYFDNLLNLFRKYVAEHQLNYVNQHTNSGHL